jgi:hypothetical protein
MQKLRRLCGVSEAEAARRNPERSEGSLLQIAAVTLQKEKPGRCLFNPEIYFCNLQSDFCNPGFHFCILTSYF